MLTRTTDEMHFRGWSVGIARDLEPYRLPPSALVITRTVPAPSQGAGATVALCVELRQGMSGRLPRILLAGTYVFDSRAAIEVVVSEAGSFDAQSVKVRGPLGDGLAVALPPSVAIAVADSLASEAAKRGYAGSLLILGGAITVDSSPSIASRCAALLFDGLLAVHDGMDLRETLEATVQNWR